MLNEQNFKHDFEIRVSSPDFDIATFDFQSKSAWIFPAEVYFDFESQGTDYYQVYICNLQHVIDETEALSSYPCPRLLCCDVPSHRALLEFLTSTRKDIGKASINEADVFRELNGIMESEFQNLDLHSIAEARYGVPPYRINSISSQIISPLGRLDTNRPQRETIAFSVTDEKGHSEKFMIDKINLDAVKNLMVVTGATFLSRTIVTNQHAVDGSAVLLNLAQSAARSATTWLQLIRNLSDFAKWEHEYLG
jgi:hypothetical protein